MWLALWLTLSAAPDNAEAIRAGVKAARPALEKCDGGTECFCTALKKVRFDISLDGGTLVVSYPFQGNGGPSFTLDASGRVIECHP